MRRFTAKDLCKYLQDCDSPPLLLDVREPWEYEKCYLEGSELVPMRQIPTEASNMDPNKETVVICHHGIRSRQVAIYLGQLGFNNVINLDGGVQAWAQDVDPTMNKY